MRATAIRALTIAATDGVAEEEQGLAGGLLNVSFQFGAALGLAVATAVYVSAVGGDASPQAMLDAYQAALVVPVAGALLAAVRTALGLVRRAPSAAQADAETAPATAQPG